MLRINRLFTIVVLVALLVSACQPIQPATKQAELPNVSDATIAQIDTLVKRMMDEQSIPGVALGVVKDGQLLYAQGFGVAELGSDKPVTPESVFLMASIAKSIVGMSIMQLVEQGKIDLDAPVAHYLPYFTLADPAAKEITVRQVLMHTSGMSDYGDWMADFHAPNQQTDDGTLEEYVRSFNTGKLLFAPGADWSYSNSGFDMLGDVIAKVSGESFEEYAQTHILTPLGMRNSTFLLSDVDAALLVAPHTYTENDTTENDTAKLQDFFPYTQKHAPSGALFSNVDDMVRFAIAAMNHGELEGTRVLSAAAYDAMWSPQVASPWGELFGPPVANYGLGWWVGTISDHRLIGNYGAEAGFQTHLAILPDDGYAVIVLTNVYNPELGILPAYEIGNALADVLLSAED